MAELLFFPRRISRTNGTLGEVDDRLPELIARLEWCLQRLRVAIDACNEGATKQFLLQQSHKLGQLIERAREQTGCFLQAMHETQGQAKPT